VTRVTATRAPAIQAALGRRRYSPYNRGMPLRRYEPSLVGIFLWLFIAMSMTVPTIRLAQRMGISARGVVIDKAPRDVGHGGYIGDVTIAEASGKAVTFHVANDGFAPDGRPLKLGDHIVKERWSALFLVNGVVQSWYGWTTMFVLWCIGVAASALCALEFGAHRRQRNGESAFSAHRDQPGLAPVLLKPYRRLANSIHLIVALAAALAVLVRVDPGGILFAFTGTLVIYGFLLTRLVPGSGTAP
jgi:hypothetical protein